MRPISEHFYDNPADGDLSLNNPTMPTQVMRRKSTGSSDIEFDTSRVDNRKTSPGPSSGTASPEQQIFQRRNSMTTRSKRGSKGPTKFYVQVSEPTNSDTELNNRILKTKKSHESLGSDAMSLSDDDEIFRDFESDNSSTISPDSYEDKVKFNIDIRVTEA